jgi:PAS domain S-box-containing protein
MFRHFGCDDPVGKTVAEILPDSYAGEMDRQDRLVITSGLPSENEGQLEVDGSVRTYLFARTPLFDAEGAPSGLCTIATEITVRKRTEDALRDVALGVSASGGEQIHRQIVRFLAKTLNVDVAMIGVLDGEDSDRIRTLAIWHSRNFIPNVTYELMGTPCEYVVGRAFEFVPRRLQELFPEDGMMRTFDLQSYAAYPLFDSQQKPLGLISVADRKPLTDRAITESILKIFSVRAASEVERARTEREKRISTASYRNIFEATEDCIFIHDFDTGRFVDMNPRACETYGYTREELLGLDVGQISSGEPPYTLETAKEYMDRARAGETVRAEWHRRNKDGSLHWDEVVLKTAVLAGRKRVLAVTRDITERKRAEAALRSREEQYRAIFNASVDGMALWSTDGRIVDVNPAFAAMHGYSRDEMLVQDPYTFVHPDSYEQLARFFDTFATGQPFHTEARDIRRDGTVLDVEVSGVLMDYLGEPHLLSIVRDITERRRAEERLRASEEQYRAIFDASADAMVLYNADGHIVDVNPAFVTLYGYTREQILEMPPQQRFHSDALPVLQRFLDRVRTGWFHEGERANRPLKEETRETTRDGRNLDLEAHLVAMYYQSRPHVLCIKRDITERKEREAALHKSEDRLRATVEAALDCIVSMDAEGNIIEFNPAAERCFGYRRAEALGQPLAELLIPERDREAHRQGLARYLTRKEGPYLGRRMQVTALRRDGTEFPAELAIAVAQGADGDIFIGYLRDITEQRQADRARVELERQLRQAQKMEAIGHLTGGIAHDFNNILTSVLGYTLLARESAAGQEKLLRYLDQVQTAGERARDLIRQMLTFSRGERGEPRFMRLSTLVTEAVRLFGSTFPSSVEFRTEPDPNAPGVRADPVLVEQVLMNLCINARDAMNGEGTIRITVDYHPALAGVCASCRQSVNGAFVELAVSDTGSGIDAGVLERMFEPFFTTKDVGRGSGMGLSTVHGVIHEHRGHLLVDTRRGAGTTFRVLFPPAASESEAPMQPDTAADSDSLTETPNSARLLVVDDEVSVREFLRDLLENRGFNVTTAADGREALSLLTQAPERFDLVISDQIMPRLTGVGMTRQLRERGILTPVLLCTGFSEGISETQAREAGVESILRKPLEPAELFGEINDLTEGLKD